MAFGCAGIYTRIFRNEESVGRAIESILGQNYKNLRYYIMVNDATRPIVEKYAQADERVKILYWHPGDKMGFCFYAPIMVEEGNEYVASLDADDWYERNWLESMIYFMEKNTLDVAACGSRFVDEAGKLRGYRGTGEDLCMDREQFPDYFPEMYQFCRTIWGKLYSAKSIRAFDPGEHPDSEEYGDYGGDTVYVLEILRGVKRFGISKRILHNYQVSFQSSSYTNFARGRLCADEFLFRFAKDFLRHLGGVNERNEIFLYAVYSFAVRDTVRMVHKNMEAREQAEAYGDIFKHELTQKAVLLSRKGKLTGEKKGDFARYITQLFLDSVCRMEKKQAECCVASWRQMLPPQEMLLKYLLQDTTFVKEYPRLIFELADGEWDEAMKLCDKLLETTENGDYQGCLAEVLLDLAALSGNIEYFVRGKYAKLVYMIKKRNTRQAVLEYQDLLEMGVSEDDLNERLSESDKDIIGLH